MMGGGSLEVEEYSQGDEQGGKRQAVANQRQVEEIHGRLEGGNKEAMMGLSGSIRLMIDGRRSFSSSHGRRRQEALPVPAPADLIGTRPPTTRLSLVCSLQRV